MTAAEEFALLRECKLGANIETHGKAMAVELGRVVTVQDLSKELKIPSKQLTKLIRNGKLAKRMLLNANLQLVFYIANWYKSRGVAYPDLVQEGALCLIKAIQTYDPDRGFRLSTYATCWINQVF